MSFKKLLTSSASVAAILVPLAYSAPAHAQASRTWVSGVGDDANPCSRTAPCKTFAGAISKTAAGGEINCLDPGGFGAVTITKSLTIDCHEIFGSVLVSGTNGINIVSDNVNALVVRLRNLNVTGITGAGVTGISITAGVNGTSNTKVVLEDMMIDGFSQKGINDARSGGGKLFVTNSTVRDNAGTGVAINGVKASIDRLRAFANGFGIGVSASANVQVINSVIAGSTSAGVLTDAGTNITIDASTISGNGTGLQPTGTLSLNNSNVAFNTTGVTGTVNSFTTNRFVGNGAGGTITAISPTNVQPSGLQ